MTGALTGVEGADPLLAGCVVCVVCGLVCLVCLVGSEVVAVGRPLEVHAASSSVTAVRT